MINVKKNLSNCQTYPVICTFYTDNWLYKYYAMEMLDMCEKLNLNYLIAEKANTKNYLRNCKYKPSFILETLKIVKRPVLWIDADGMLLQKPTFFKNIDFDFAAKKMPEERSRTWHVGTMFFNYNQKSISLVEEWKTYTKNAISDEHGLDLLWNKNYFQENNITSVDIPPEYFHILHKKYGPVTEATVISHRISKSSQKNKAK